ncbi:MAG: glycosyltransferase [Candidatus Tectimicrobiota bacterium]
MITYVLPAYNEAENVAVLLEKIAKTMAQAEQTYSVVVVDDGSTDGMAAILERKKAEMPLTVLSHPQNQGLGRAVRTGLLHAVGTLPPEAVVIVMDADNTFDPSHTPAMWRALEAGADLVIASRFAPGGEEVGVQFHRRVLSRLARAVLTLLYHVPGVRDYTCSFRAYRVELLQRGLEVYGEHLTTSRGFPIMAELLIKLAALGPQVVEVPLTLRYDLKRGRSKLAIARTVCEYLSMLLRSLPSVVAARRRGASRA